MWSGEFIKYPKPSQRSYPNRYGIINELVNIPFPAYKRLYLTRIETRMHPTVMTENIHFTVDLTPNELWVKIYKY